jgi:hypothetical protein
MLCRNRKWPKRGSPAEQRDKLAPFHLVTSIDRLKRRKRATKKTTGSVPFARRRKPSTIAEILRLRGMPRALSTGYHN